MGTSPAITAIDVVAGFALGLAFLVFFGVDIPTLARGLRGGRSEKATPSTQAASPVMAAGD
jgi:hypothetical protein